MSILNPIQGTVPRGGTGAQCQGSDLRWTKVKRAQVSHETKNPQFFRQFHYKIHWLEVTKPYDSPYTKKKPLAACKFY